MAAAAEGYLGIADDPRMRFRETEYDAAFYFQLPDQMSQLPLPPERMMTCLSGQNHNTSDFDGHRTFFTARGWGKPTRVVAVKGHVLAKDWRPMKYW